MEGWNHLNLHLELKRRWLWWLVGQTHAPRWVLDWWATCLAREARFAFFLMEGFWWRMHNLLIALTLGLTVPCWASSYAIWHNAIFIVRNDETWSTVMSQFSPKTQPVTRNTNGQQLVLKLAGAAHQRVRKFKLMLSWLIFDCYH